MNASELCRKVNGNPPRKRVGRGNGSGTGRTAGRGHKGQKSRSGGGVRPGFEGGQMPLFRRLPKRGFNNAVFRNEYDTINLNDIIGLDAGTEITPESVQSMGFAKKVKYGIKLLGQLDEGSAVPQGLKVKLHRVSKSAKAAIEAAGGTVEELHDPIARDQLRTKRRKYSEPITRKELLKQQQEAKKG